MYAILRDSGRQYRVQEGDRLLLETKPGVEAGQDLVLTDVLLYADGDDVRVGAPTVPGCTVKVHAVGASKGPKLVVQKFRRRTNFEKRRGHRQHFLDVRIQEIRAE